MPIMHKYSVRSESNTIQAVMLYKPGPEVESVAEPQAVFYKSCINHKKISTEFDSMIETYRNLGIDVHLVEPNTPNRDDPGLLNLMFCRDLLFMTTAGAILSNMKHWVRKDEPSYAQAVLSKLGIPIIHEITAEGTFEGADALWITDTFVLIGVGNRTDNYGYQQTKSILNKLGINCECVRVPKGIQHLLGVLQMVDKDIALVRTQIVDPDLISILESYDINIIPIPETNEVTLSQAMNIVTVSPRHIIMPDDCPDTEQLYVNNDIVVVSKVKVNELRNGAGGLACATCILSRS